MAEAQSEPTVISGSDEKHVGLEQHEVDSTKTAEIPGLNVSQVAQQPTAVTGPRLLVIMMSVILWVFFTQRSTSFN